jgi:hypothetical protein
MTKAQNYELCGKSAMSAKYANNASVSDVFSEFGELLCHIFADGSVLKVSDWTEIQESEIAAL